MAAPVTVLPLLIKEVAQFEDFLLTRDHVLAWEGEHGKIPAGVWVLLRTDWSKRQGREAFLNAKEDGPHSPGWTAEAGPNADS